MVYNIGGVGLEDGGCFEGLTVISDPTESLLVFKRELRIVTRDWRSLIYLRGLFLIIVCSSEFVGTAMEIWSFWRMNLDLTSRMKIESSRYRYFSENISCQYFSSTRFSWIYFLIFSMFV